MFRDQVGNVVVFDAVKVPAADLLANVHEFPPSPEVASNDQDHGTLDSGTEIDPLNDGRNINVIVKESDRVRSEYPTKSSWYGLSLVELPVDTRPFPSKVESSLTNIAMEHRRNLMETGLPPVGLPWPPNEKSVSSLFDACRIGPFLATVSAKPGSQRVRGGTSFGSAL